MKEEKSKTGEKFAFVAVGVILDRMLFKPSGKLIWFGLGVIAMGLYMEILPKLLGV